MTPEEVLLFTCFDSNHPTIFENTPVPRYMHTVLQDLLRIKHLGYSIPAHFGLGWLQIKIYRDIMNIISVSVVFHPELGARLVHFLFLLLLLIDIYFIILAIE